MGHEHADSIPHFLDRRCEAELEETGEGYSEEDEKGEDQVNTVNEGRFLEV